MMSVKGEVIELSYWQSA